MSYGLVISKAGYNVLSDALADKNKIFDSSLDHLKTAVSGSYTETVAAWDNETVYVTHDLGDYPLSMCYFTDDEDSDYYKITMSYDPSVGGSRIAVSDINVSMFCTTTRTYFRIYNTTGTSRDVTIEYEIFYEGD